MCTFSCFPCRRNAKSYFFTDYVSSTYSNTKKIGLHFFVSIIRHNGSKFKMATRFFEFF